jgi:hypothetical protein
MVVTSLLIIFQLYPDRQFYWCIIKQCPNGHVNILYCPVTIDYQIWIRSFVRSLGCKTKDNILFTWLEYRENQCSDIPAYGGYPTFNHISVISWRSVLLVEDKRAQSHNISGDRHWLSHRLFIYEADANDKIYQI